MNKPVSIIDEAGAQREPATASPFMNLHEIIAKARANLNQNDWDYIVGGTETETTLRRNRMALDAVAFRPRVLRDVSKVDPSVEVLGKKLRLPIDLARWVRWRSYPYGDIGYVASTGSVRRLAPKPLSPRDVEEAVAELRRQLHGVTEQSLERIDCSPETIEQGLAKLVLGLIELLRRLLERQAIRRMEGNSLTEQQVEEMGQALMVLEQKIAEIAQQFGLKPEDLNLALGPLGNLLE